MGDTIATNMFMLGYAWQKAWVPLSEGALLKSIELNGISVDFNIRAFAWGRAAAHDLAAIEKLATPEHPIVFHRKLSLDDLITQRVEFLTDYQNAAYAQNYLKFVNQVRILEAALSNAPVSMQLTEAVARYYFKLLAHKDEYEVARLQTDGNFAARIADMFEGDYKLRYHLAPPLLAKRNRDGILVKRDYGTWVIHVFRLLKKLRFLRGTVFDIFAYTKGRQIERALAKQYRDRLTELLPRMTTANFATIVAIASIPEEIRGYGHVRARHLKAAQEKEKVLMAAFNLAK